MKSLKKIKLREREFLCDSKTLSYPQSIKENLTQNQTGYKAFFLLTKYSLALNIISKDKLLFNISNFDNYIFLIFTCTNNIWLKTNIFLDISCQCPSTKEENVLLIF